MSLPRARAVVETCEVQDCRVFRVRQIRARSPRDGVAHPFWRLDADPWTER